MAIARKLKNMMLFNDANSYQGIVKSVTLPTLARKMEAWRGGGMNGPVQVDLGLSDDGLQIEWTLGGWDMLAFRQWGISTVSGVQLRFDGALQRDDTGEVSSVEVVIRGRHSEIDSGEATPGEDTEHSITTVCSYYKLTVDGEVIIEIDIPGMIEMIDGEDRLAEQRKALGL